MASYSMEEFIGNGALKGLLPKLLEEGWDDVPTLKIMNSEDMDAINMTQRQKEALEIRKYLHDRALMQYGDQLEASGKCLPELLGLSAADLSTQMSMKRGHIARFMDRTSACAAADPLPIRRITTAHRSFPATSSTNYDALSLDQSSNDLKIKDDPWSTGACGCAVQPSPAVGSVVASYAAIENISIQKLTPEYKIGMERLVKTKTPPMKASQLWRDKPAILLCIRRPGCIMCRAEAYQLYANKPAFDALGVQLFVVLHENIEAEVDDFWPRYWGGAVLFDGGREFFKALGGGKLMKEKFISGFLFNPRAIANYKRAKAMGVKQNFRGGGEIKGGLFVVGRGRSGIAYQFIERNFGDWAPLAEVVDICARLQNQQPGKGQSFKA